MRKPRILGEGRTYHHVVDRIAGQYHLFEDQDKQAICKIMRAMEAFSGVNVVTYCIMSNHVHFLLEVPDREILAPLSEAELIGVLPQLYDQATVESIAEELERARESNNAEWHAEIMGRYERRRGNLSIFVKELKQRISIHVNRRLGRTGTLWEGRFKNVLVEDCEKALITMAAYIDLNPVRAGLVKHPEDYRWSGYGEAMSPNESGNLARERLGRILSESLSNPEYASDWKTTAARYRLLLFEEGQERIADSVTGEGGRVGFSQEQVDEVVASQGKMSLQSALRHRVRYFRDGAVFGTAAFVDRIFEVERSSGNRAWKKRTTGAREMRGAEWGDLFVLRDLRKDVIGGSPPE